MKSLPAPTMETKPLVTDEPPKLPCCNLSRCGFLTKEGGNFKNWKRRWFSLQVATKCDNTKIPRDQFELKYFDFDAKGCPTTMKGAILLRDVTGINSEVLKEGDGKRMITLVGGTATARVYKLQADSDEEHEDWLQALELAVQVATGKQDWPEDGPSSTDARGPSTQGEEPAAADRGAMAEVEAAC